ncbi:MAG: hypothetical protein ACLFR7_07035 [Opitutales bacterium]
MAKRNETKAPRSPKTPKAPRKKDAPRKAKKARPEADGTWRSINQRGNLRSGSAAARERRWTRFVRTAAVVSGVLLLGGGLGYALWFSGSHLGALNPAPAAAPLSRIDFASDGVLDEAWFRETFPLTLSSRVPAIEYDVHALKALLEGVGQVAAATVSISLPDTLIVRLSEHEPILRARVRDPAGEVRGVLIAADGTVYQGINYPLEVWRRLPGLTGVRFRWEGDRVLPIAAMSTVAPLLAQAREEFPALYREWQWISLEQMGQDPTAPHSLIAVRSREADRIVFAPRVFHRQLRKLSEVVAMTRTHTGGFRKIDLSFPDQAIVQTRDL